MAPGLSATDQFLPVARIIASVEIVGSGIHMTPQSLRVSHVRMASSSTQNVLKKEK
jgi:hypothetical protein